MKLRDRSLESKETLKIEVPDSCSLQQLKETLSRAISSPSSSLHLSLNRKDEITASTANESLHSIGIASGDLVFYSLNPNAFSLETALVHKPGPSETEHTDLVTQETPNQHSSSGQMEVGETDMMTDDISELEKPVISEGMEVIDGSVEVMGKNDSEPSFVKRVLRETLSNDFNDVELLVVAVHAIILESGFVLLDKVSGVAVSCSNILDQWPSATSTLSVRYTLPDILTNDSDSTRTVVLKFQSLGHFVNVYGSLSVGGSGLHRVSFDKRKFAPPVELMLGKSGSNDNTNSGVYNRENDVFQLWKMVKDGLALPLLIDLCEEAGLGSPPCFMRLPTELKLKVLEYLHGVDIAKVACTCSEMRYLSSNNDLWKQKFEELVGRRKLEQGTNSYKCSFANEWVAMQRSKRHLDRAIIVRNDNPTYYRIRRDPNPFGIPSVVGGDYDRIPGFGVRSPFGQPGLPFHTFQPRRRFHPMCDLHE
ncbi:F-box protein SKIP22-like [Prosopis cineraria]|uniref:F-box protein SKIP22-like n=1 Tax=Prosopis cineraria TaxID=364024 RepID=UPI00240F0B8A|nr:F-box protein SKIP22-like [Prosopis cineraria]